MKLWKVFWGFLFIFLALFLIFDSIGLLAPIQGVFGEVSFFRLAAACFQAAVSHRMPEIERIYAFDKSSVSSLFTSLSKCVML